MFQLSRFGFVIVAVALLLSGSTAFGQGQISPNPNPAGNTITLNNGSDWWNDVVFENNGEIQLHEPDTLTNTINDTLNNNGWLEIDGLFADDDAGLLNNFGVFTNKGQLINNFGGTLNNFGAMTHEEASFGGTTASLPTIMASALLKTAAR